MLGVFFHLALPLFQSEAGKGRPSLAQEQPFRGPESFTVVRQLCQQSHGGNTRSFHDVANNCVCVSVCVFLGYPFQINGFKSQKEIAIRGLPNIDAPKWIDPLILSPRRQEAQLALPPCS